MPSPEEPVEEVLEELPDEHETGEPDFLIRNAEYSKAKLDYRRIAAGVFAGLAIVAIAVFSVTDLSAILLPMDDRYLEVLVPRTEDGSEPFILNELNHVLDENTLSVTGVVTNNSSDSVENIVAVITARDTTGRFPATLEIPVDPEMIEPEESGTFSMSVTLRQKPDHYTVRFKLANGPFVPHKEALGTNLELEIPIG